MFRLLAWLFVPTLALNSHGDRHEVHQESSLGREEISSIPMHLYRKDCWKKRPVKKRFNSHRAAASLLRGSATTNNPGAGMGEITPYETVYKDGFYLVDCTKDYMFSFGDKHGNNADQYKLEERSNVSIVFYNDNVDRADREKMTHAACFAFCRTVPDMLYFGIVNGGNCYCAPYYQPSAGDSSQCDAVCDGDSTVTCGGKTKSTIFGMHMCNTAEKDYLEAYQKAMDMDGDLQSLALNLGNAGTEIQRSAESAQKAFGKVGDSGATALMQQAKQWAGEVEEAVGAANKMRDSWQSSDGGVLNPNTVTGQGTQSAPFAFTSSHSSKLASGDSDVNEQVEAHTSKLARMVVSGEKVMQDLGSMYELAKPDFKASNDTHEYYPVMYFVDKEFEGVPSTCGGDIVGKPLLATYEDCAQACDNEINSCVGFSHFATRTSGDGFCFMFSKLKTATYYTKCGSSALKVTCAAKLAKFSGVSLAPKKDGKCDLCLTEARSVNKCYDNY